jgi:hypothetical protein
MVAGLPNDIKGTFVSVQPYARIFYLRDLPHPIVFGNAIIVGDNDFSNDNGKPLETVGRKAKGPSLSKDGSRATERRTKYEKAYCTNCFNCAFNSL